MIRAIDSLIAEGDLIVDHGVVCFPKLSSLDSLKPIMTEQGLAIRGCARDGRVHVFSQHKEKHVGLRCLSRERWHEALSVPVTGLNLAQACEKRLLRLIKVRDTSEFSHAFTSPMPEGDGFTLHALRAYKFEESSEAHTAIQPIKPASRTVKAMATPLQDTPASKPAAPHKTMASTPMKMMPISQVNLPPLRVNPVQKPLKNPVFGRAWKGLHSVTEALHKPADALVRELKETLAESMGKDTIDLSEDLNKKRTKRIKQRIVNLSAHSFMGMSHPGPVGSVYIPVQIDEDSCGGLSAKHALVHTMPANTPAGKIFGLVYNHADHSVGLLVRNQALLESVLLHPEKVRKLNVDIAHQLGMQALHGEACEERLRRFHSRIFEAAATYIGVAAVPFSNFAALNQGLVMAGSARFLENVKVKNKDIGVERAVPILALSASLHQQLAASVLAQRQDTDMSLSEVLLLGASVDAIVRSYSLSNGLIDLDTLTMHASAFEKLMQAKTSTERAVGAMGLHIMATVREAKERDAQRPVDYSQQYEALLPSQTWRPEDDVYVSKLK
jgi:hypothetical protein